MKQFLIVFDRPTSEILEMVEFADGDRDVAFKELFDREERYRADPDKEVVMLGSDSVQALKLTHARYFKDELAKLIAALG